MTKTQAHKQKTKLKCTELLQNFHRNQNKPGGKQNHHILEEKTAENKRWNTNWVRIKKHKNNNTET